MSVDFNDLFLNEHTEMEHYEDLIPPLEDIFQISQYMDIPDRNVLCDLSNQQEIPDLLDQQETYEPSNYQDMYELVNHQDMYETVNHQETYESSNRQQIYDVIEREDIKIKPSKIEPLKIDPSKIVIDNIPDVTSNENEMSDKKQLEMIRCKLLNRLCDFLNVIEMRRDLWFVGTSRQTQVYEKIQKIASCYRTHYYGLLRYQNDINIQRKIIDSFLCYLSHRDMSWNKIQGIIFRKKRSETVDLMMIRNGQKLYSDILCLFKDMKDRIVMIK